MSNPNEAEDFETSYGRTCASRICLFFKKLIVSHPLIASVIQKTAMKRQMNKEKKKFKKDKVEQEKKKIITEEEINILAEFLDDNYNSG
jgi:hypothetical protein